MAQTMAVSSPQNLLMLPGKLSDTLSPVQVRPLSCHARLELTVRGNLDRVIFVRKNKNSANCSFELQPSTATSSFESSRYPGAGGKYNLPDSSYHAIPGAGAASGPTRDRPHSRNSNAASTTPTISDSVSSQPLGHRPVLDSSPTLGSSGTDYTPIQDKSCAETGQRRITNERENSVLDENAITKNSTAGRPATSIPFVSEGSTNSNTEESKRAHESSRGAHADSHQRTEEVVPQQSAGGGGVNRGGVSSKEKRLPFIGPRQYLNDPKLPRWKVGGGKGSVKIQRQGGVRELGQKLVAMKASEDIDAVLNAWEHRGSRVHFPMLIKVGGQKGRQVSMFRPTVGFGVVWQEVVRGGDLVLSLKVFNWMKAQRCYRAQTAVYNDLCHLAARHRSVTRARHLFYEMLEWRCKPDVETYNALIGAHGKAGDWRGAIKMFDTMLRDQVAPSRSSYNSLINACGSSGQWELALEMFEKMKGEGVAPDVVTHNTILTAYRNAEKHEKALEYFDEMRANGVLPDGVSYIVVMGCHSRLGNFDETVALFEQMQQGRLGGCNIVVYNLVMHAYAAGGRSKEAKSMFEKMEGAGIRPDLVSFNTLIDAYARCGMHEQAQAVFESLKERGFYPDLITYSSLINAYSKAGLPEEALRIFRKATGRSLRPNAVLFNVLIDAFGRMGRLEEAVELREEMHAAGISSTVVTMGSLIRASGAVGRPELTRKFHEEAKLRRISLTVEGHNCLLHAYLATGETEEAHRIFREMREGGSDAPPPDQVSYGIMMDALGREGRVGEVEDLLQEMLEKKRGRVSVEIGSSIIDAYGTQGDLTSATLMMERMKEAGTHPNVVCYSALIRAHGVASQPDEALRVWQEMRAEGVVPDSVAAATLMNALNKGGRHVEVLAVAGEWREERSGVVYNEMLTACRKLLDWEAAEAVGREMAGREGVGSVRTYTLLVDALGRSGKLQLALQRFEEMKSLGLVPTLQTFNAVLRAFSRAAKWRQAVGVLDWMAEAGVQPSLQTFNLLLGCLAKAGAWEEAMAVYQRMQDAGVGGDKVSFHTLQGVLKKAGQEERALEVARGWGQGGPAGEKRREERERERVEIERLIKKLVGREMEVVGGGGGQGEGAEQLGGVGMRGGGEEDVDEGESCRWQEDNDLDGVQRGNRN